MTFEIYHLENIMDFLKICAFIQYWTLVIEEYSRQLTDADPFNQCVFFIQKTFFDITHKHDLLYSVVCGVVQCNMNIF